MTIFNVHTKETAPEGSKEILEATEKAYGFVPNLMAVFSESPAVIEGYAAISGAFDKSDFTATERQIVSMANSRLNECTYCMSAHTTVSKMQGVPADVIESLRAGTSIADPKLEALRVFTLKINQNRGVVSDADMAVFLAVGYTKANILEVILGTAHKVFSNYADHVTKTPIDAPFQADAWSVESGVAA